MPREKRAEEGCLARKRELWAGSNVLSMFKATRVVST
jgi:hypothetical protein